MRESEILHSSVKGVTAVGDVIRRYIYYSDDKIHELDQQLPEAKWWHRTQGGGATVLGTGANIDFGPQETKPVLRTMQKVWRYLERMQQVGSFDEPRQYFYGRLAFYLEFFDSVNPQLFFLIGDTGQTVVALGGQKKHVRGFRGQQSRQRAGAPSIVIETDLVRYLDVEIQGIAIAKRITSYHAGRRVEQTCRRYVLEVEGRKNRIRGACRPRIVLTSNQD